MRIGEAVALEWKDIDFEKMTISISKTLVRTKQYNRKNEKLKDERVRINTTKTYEGTRIIPMSDYVAVAFKMWKAKQLRDKERFSEWGKKNYLLRDYPGLIFTTSTGHYLSPNDAWRYCEQGVDRVNEQEVHLAKIEKREPDLLILHPHILRHTYATRCLEAGMHPKALQKLLGHASMDMLEIYTHPSMEFLKQQTGTYSITPC